MVCPQWDDQRAEKVIKEVCLSISGLLSIKNDLSLRWTGYLTKSLLSKSHGSSLISWMTGQFLPLSCVQNRQLLKGKPHKSVSGEMHSCVIDRFSPYHCCSIASHEALRLNWHMLCKQTAVLL